MRMTGADAWLKYFGELPGYYISEDEAKLLGWVNIYGNLDKVAPGKCYQKGFIEMTMAFCHKRTIAYGMKPI